MVPVEFAGLKVWHEPQPFAEKTASPAAALPPPPEDFVVPPDFVVPLDVVVGAEVVAGADVDPIVTVCSTVADDFPPSEV
jgi:hypothetical protein